MKVLIVNNFLKNTLGGVENYLETLCSYSKKNNADVIFRWYGVENTKTNWLQKFYNAKTTTEIIKEIDTFQPDIIHCYSIGATVTPHFMNYAKKKNIPIIHSYRDYYYICPKNYMLDTNGNVIVEHNHYLQCVLRHLPKKNFIYDSLLYWKQHYHKKFIKKYVDYFITPSERLSEMITNEFRKPGETLPNPVLINTENIEIIEGEYLLYVGRLEPEKGVLTLLKAFQKVIENFPEEKLIIVGSGSIQHLLELYVRENNLTNVLFLGVKNKSNLKELYARAKFTIVPSEFLESYGNVILESFALKKAVIISDLLGIKNEVVENNCGLVFPYGNISELQEAIENLLTDTVLRKRFETNAAQYVSKLTFENHFLQLKEIYFRVINKSF